jgi:6-phosphogluconolactonase
MQHASHTLTSIWFRRDFTAMPNHMNRASPGTVAVKTAKSDSALGQFSAGNPAGTVQSCKFSMTDQRPNPRLYSYRPVEAHRGSESYGLIENRLVGPSIPGATDVIAAETADELIDKLAADLVVHAENCVRQFGDFHLALSGGSTPQPLYERLMYDPNYRRLPWRRTHLWIVDERCVGFDHQQSNFHMIDETIVEHADIPREQVHPMFATSPEGDLEYEQQLREALAWREKGQDRLDFVLLGVGTDGHTASLFPHSPAIHETDRLVAFNAHPQAVPPERLTMTFPLINSSRFIAVLVTGASKAAVIKRIAVAAQAADRELASRGLGGVEELPIKGVAPLNGELRWYLDAAACGIDPA